jgi:RNA polymerase sigma-70 factor (ECF subfamily)
MTSTRSHRRPITGFDAELLRRLHDGDRDAFGQLYAAAYGVLARYVAARLRGRDTDAVGDLVHDAFCDALADPTLIGPDLLGSMLRLAARAVTRHGWSRRRYVRAAYTIYTDRTAGTGADLNAARRAPSVLGRIRFAGALAHLTVGQRRVIQLRYLDGDNRVHAAAAMRRSVPAVRGLERRALRRLQATYTA